MKEGFSAYLHQKETVAFLLSNQFAFCLDQMGTGKTLSACWAADFLMINDAVQRVLVASPLSTMNPAWGKDLLYNLPHRKFAICHGTREYRTRILRGNAEIIIINHDGLKLMEEEILKSRFQLFIIDELTAFKNFNTDRTKAAMRIARTMKGVWGFTGEPTPNAPVEAFGQAKIVNPTNPFLPKYFGQFRDLTMEKVNEYIWIPKHNANELVHKVLQPAILHRRDDCVDLPPCTSVNREIALSPEQAVAYEVMRKQLKIEYEQGLITAANAGVKALKLLQIAAGSVKDDEGRVVHLPAGPRYNELLDIFENTPQRKLIVFTAFRACVERVVEFFGTKKIRFGAIYGGVDQKVRSRLIDEFQNGDLAGLSIQPQSCAHGVTLTAANNVAWHSLIPSNEIYNQANHRIIRIGQTRAQLITHLIGSKAEQHTFNILTGKQDQSEDLLERFVGFLEA
jgi:SNF2 family DNA or RNA helicase